MNELETRLHSALREAVPDLDVPAGLVPAALRGAVRVRRRRAAAGSAVGAAAVAAGVAAWPTPQDARRVTPVASRSVSAPLTPRTKPVTVTVDDQCTTRVQADEIPPDARCRAVRVEFSQPDGTAVRQHVYDTWRMGDDVPATAPDRLDVTFSDGSTASYEPRRAPGPGTAWVFDVVVPEGARLTELGIVNGADKTVLRWVDDTR